MRIALAHSARVLFFALAVVDKSVDKYTYYYQKSEDNKRHNDLL
jgi:hypothetical protein